MAEHGGQLLVHLFDVNVRVTVLTEKQFGLQFVCVVHQFFLQPRIDYFAALFDRFADMLVHRRQCVGDRLLIEILVVEVRLALIQLGLEIVGNLFERLLYHIHLSADGFAKLLELVRLLDKG